MRNDELLKILKPGEALEEIDKTGWVVLRNLLGPGEEIGIRPFGVSSWFSVPVRAIVDGISSINTISLEIASGDARDRRGRPIPLGHIDGWLDIMWDCVLIVPEVKPPTTSIKLQLQDRRPHRDLTVYPVDLEKENEWAWFGHTPERKWRVWLKKEWEEVL